MNKRELFIVLFLFLAGYVTAGSITGRVHDGKTSAVLAGAEVTVKGTAFGATTGENGAFELSGIPDGEYTIVISSTGYERDEFRVTVGPEATAVDRQLTPVTLTQASDTITVVAKIANRANARKTPVAFSDRDKLQLTREAGSRDLPLVLNTCPGVHSNESGGGTGDATTTVRGFDFHNVAILINGMPVNDMESDWIYWSNWNGLIDVTSSVQVQRGLGATNLAVSSMGGIINILTDPASRERRITFKQDYGSGTALKSTLTANTGLLDEKFAASLLVQRATQNGVFDQTWAESYLYYTGFSYKANRRHKFEGFVFGSPQRHGNNSTKLKMWDYDKEYARDVLKDQGYTDAVIDDTLKNAADYGVTFNEKWGPLSGITTSDLTEYFNGEVHDFEDRSPYINGKKQSGGLIMEAANYYHKPMLNCNWHWKYSSKLLLTNTAYYAHGKGGAAFYGGNTPRYGDGVFKGLIDFKSIYDSNANTIDPAYSATKSRAQGIMVNWTNEHYWYGLLSRAEYQLTPTSAMTLGIDGRYYKSELFPEIRSLLGGDYYIDFGDANQSSPVKQQGDKIWYHYGGNVRWLGGFAGYEEKFGDITAIFSGSLAHKGYKRRDYFVDRTKKNVELGWKNFLTGLFKAGANYNITPNLALFSSAGFFSKPPFLEGGVFDFSHEEIDNPVNEKNYSVDIGTVVTTLAGMIKMNLYGTYWKDRTWQGKSTITDPKSGEKQIFYYLLRGIDARHAGIEMESELKLCGWVDLNTSASIGNWRWMSDVTATYAPDWHHDSITTISVYSKNLKVGNAPQSAASVGLTFKPLEKAYIMGQWELYANYCANFDPINRQSKDDYGKQPWQIPWYQLLNFHFGYTLPFSPRGVQFELFGHVFNALNTVYISEAQDGNSHEAWDVLVRMGSPRWFNTGMKVGF